MALSCRVKIFSQIQIPVGAREIQANQWRYHCNGKMGIRAVVVAHLADRLLSTQKFVIFSVNLLPELCREFELKIGPLVKRQTCGLFLNDEPIAAYHTNSLLLGGLTISHLYLNFDYRIVWHVEVCCCSWSKRDRFFERKKSRDKESNKHPWHFFLNLERQSGYQGDLHPVNRLTFFTRRNSVGSIEFRNNGILELRSRGSFLHLWVMLVKRQLS